MVATATATALMQSCDAGGQFAAYASSGEYPLFPCRHRARTTGTKQSPSGCRRVRDQPISGPPARTSTLRSASFGAVHGGSEVTKPRGAPQKFEVAGETVVHDRSLFTGTDHPGRPQQAQCVGDAVLVHRQGQGQVADSQFLRCVQRADQP